MAMRSVTILIKLLNTLQCLLNTANLPGDHYCTSPQTCRTCRSDRFQQIVVIDDKLRLAWIERPNLSIYLCRHLHQISFFRGARLSFRVTQDNHLPRQNPVAEVRVQPIKVIRLCGCVSV